MLNIKERKRIVLITPILQPYRISFYTKLYKALLDDSELIVYHGTKLKEDGRPSYSGAVPFMEKGFPIKTITLFSLTMVLNTGMYRSLKIYDPDLVIMQGIAGNLSLRLIARWVKKQNRILIFWTCGWEPGVVKGWQLYLKNRFVSSFFRRGNFHLTYSLNATNYVESMGVKRSNIETCYNGIETDDLTFKSKEILLTSCEIRKKYDLESYLTFLYVGGLMEEKRVSLLIDAFKILHSKYSKIKLILIGDGPQKEIIEEQLKTYDDRTILYFGRILDGVDSYFAAADCFILPGVGGLALAQAMFWGKSCIVSKADGTEDDLIFEGVTGYRFDENNLESLISAMDKRINEKKDKIDNMSENARQLIQNRSNVNKMIDLFLQTIKRFIL